MAKRLLFLALFLCIACLVASASVDPRIEIVEPGCQQGDFVVGADQLFSGFSFTSISGGGTYHFCNETGVDWTSLLIGIRTTVPASSIICPSANSQTDPLNTAQLAFSTCLILPTGPQPGIIYAKFFGTDPPDPLFNYNGFLGVPNGERFTVDLNCGNFDGCDPWPDGSLFVGVPNNLAIPQVPVPEPASLALLGTALVGGVLRRRIIA